MTIDVRDETVCEDEQQRRADVLAHPTLNGIDYLEVDAADHRKLSVFFLKPVPPANAANPADPDDAYGLSADPSRATISGGARIVGLEAVSITRQPDGHLELLVSAGGDFSFYTLTLDAPALDPVLRRTRFSFMAACPTDFDCRPRHVCPPREGPALDLDYQAKDYASFRRLMLELAPRFNPGWTERNPADLGVTLVELLAYTGDQLSYFQDAAANEAYLETLRHRISARRHARLVDYCMHDGRNAWTWVHVTVDGAAVLDRGSKVVTRIAAPLAGQTLPPPVVVEDFRITAQTLERDPALAGAVVFETAHQVALDPRHNELHVHAWGNEDCCLVTGTREAFLYFVAPGATTAERPVLAPGEFLLLEEVLGRATGLPADADPQRRQVVRLEVVEATQDPVYSDQILGGGLQRRGPGDPALPLLRVGWRVEDATREPFCLSVRQPGGGLVRDVTVARGNLVLADHGVTTEEVFSFEQPVPPDRPFRLRLSRGPLTMQAEPPVVDINPITGRLLTERTALDGDARAASPAVALLAAFPARTELWTPVRDLLDSPPFAQDFVAEVDDDGLGLLRFGDGEYGREVAGAVALRAVYRVGNGPAGNVGREALAHLALGAPAGFVRGVRNPLAAVAGTAPESITEVARRAPQAFRAEQFRAVTEADYTAAARKLPEVAGAVASFRWTGSWYTVFVGVDPRDPADLVRLSKGLARLSPALEAKVRAFLGRYRLAGYDLEIRPPHFVPLELALDLCVAPDHFRADVTAAVFEALGNRQTAAGPGFFHPDNFTFGTPVYLSALYAAVERVEGVESATVRIFQRQGVPDGAALASGVLPIGPWEIAILDNDPSFMENGVLHVTARGGKA
jgi:hypothetical protein